MWKTIRGETTQVSKSNAWSNNLKQTNALNKLSAFKSFEYRSATLKLMLLNKYRVIVVLFERMLSKRHIIVDLSKWMPSKCHINVDRSNQVVNAEFNKSIASISHNVQLLRPIYSRYGFSLQNIRNLGACRFTVDVFHRFQRYAIYYRSNFHWLNVVEVIVNFPFDYRLNGILINQQFLSRCSASWQGCSWQLWPTTAPTPCYLFKPEWLFNVCCFQLDCLRVACLPGQCNSTPIINESERG